MVSLFGVLMPKGEKSHLHVFQLDLVDFHLDLVGSQALISSFACLCPMVDELIYYYVLNYVCAYCVVDLMIIVDYRY